MPGFEAVHVALPDGYRAEGRYWPVSHPKGAVLYHHGIQSHCGWFERSCRSLAEAGYCVLQVDRRGCGRNMLDRGHADSAEQLNADSWAAADDLRRRSGFDRYHLLGVSWGGKLAVSAYVGRPEGVRSLSLITPGLFPLTGVSKEQAATIGFAMLYEPRRLFDIPLNDPVLFTHVSRWQEFFLSDELTLRQCTAGFYLASRRMDRMVAKLSQSEPVHIHLLTAGDERIIDNERTIRFIEELGWTGFRHTHNEAARHALEFEDPESLCRDITDFLGTIDHY